MKITEVVKAADQNGGAPLTDEQKKLAEKQVIPFIRKVTDSDREELTAAQCATLVRWMDANEISDLNGVRQELGLGENQFLFNAVTKIVARRRQSAYSSMEGQWATENQLNLLNAFVELCTKTDKVVLAQRLSDIGDAGDSAEVSKAIDHAKLRLGVDSDEVWALISTENPVENVVASAMANDDEEPF